MEVKHVSFAYDSEEILHDISFQIKEGNITTIMGANGCGKSTLLHIMSRNLNYHQGKVLLNNVDVTTYSMKEFAHKLSIVHQNHTAPKDLTVEKLVGYGRVPYLGFGRSLSKEDHEIIHWAMEVTNTLSHRTQCVQELSGGQRQRVWIAMALAQKSEILLLDEPTTFLDIHYQMEILKLIRRLNKEFHMTIVMVLHDINQAIFYSDEILAMKQGRIIRHGNSKEIIDEALIQELYDVSFSIIPYKDRNYVMTI